MGSRQNYKARRIILTIEERSPLRGKQEWLRYQLSDQFETGEEIADFEGGGVGRVGAVRNVVADAGTEVVTNRAGRGFFRVGGAHRIAPFKDSAFGFEDHGNDFAGAHEVGKLAEK